MKYLITLRQDVSSDKLRLVSDFPLTAIITCKVGLVIRISQNYNKKTVEIESL